MQASLCPHCSVISLRSDSLRFYTENFPDFLYAAEKNVGSTIKLFFSREASRNLSLTRRAKACERYKKTLTKDFSPKSIKSSPGGWFGKGGCFLLLHFLCAKENDDNASSLRRKNLIVIQQS
jgi:hypothetical protein